MVPETATDNDNSFLMTHHTSDFTASSNEFNLSPFIIICSWRPTRKSVTLHKRGKKDEDTSKTEYHHICQDNNTVDNNKAK